MHEYPTRYSHVALSVRGYLTGSNRDCAHLFRHPGGEWLTPAEAKEVLADYLAQGIELLPIGKACEGWSPLTGCPGHEGTAPDAV